MEFSIETECPEGLYINKMWDSNKIRFFEKYQGRFFRLVWKNDKHETVLSESLYRIPTECDYLMGLHGISKLGDGVRYNTFCLNKQGVSIAGVCGNTKIKLVEPVEIKVLTK